METKHVMHGVEGTMTTRARKLPGKRGIVTFKDQKFTASREFREDGVTKTIIVNVEFDDDPENGHNTLSVTGSIYNPKYPGDSESCGCIHDEIAQHFSELAHLIKWHLTSTDGPWGYPSNPAYFAGDRDHNGKAKGQPWAWDDVAYFGNSPMPVKIKSSKFLEWVKARIEFMTGNVLKTNPAYYSFEALPVEHKDNGAPGSHHYDPRYTLKGYDVQWAFCPFDNPTVAHAWVQALNWHVDGLREKRDGFISFDKIPTLFSEGKNRELDKARRSAIWPEATDEQLCLPRAELTELLMARLPALIEAFKADVLACGFKWSVE